jgi:acetyl esterase/lipase
MTCCATEEAYGRKLIEAGVEVVTTRYNATIHDFVILNALAPGCADALIDGPGR